MVSSHKGGASSSQGAAEDIRTYWQVQEEWQLFLPLRGPGLLLDACLCGIAAGCAHAQAGVALPFADQLLCLQHQHCERPDVAFIRLLGLVKNVRPTGPCEVPWLDFVIASRRTRQAVNEMRMILPGGRPTAATTCSKKGNLHVCVCSNLEACNQPCNIHCIIINAYSPMFWRRARHRETCSKEHRSKVQLSAQMSYD